VQTLVVAFGKALLPERLSTVEIDVAKRCQKRPGRHATTFGHTARDVNGMAMPEGSARSTSPWHRSRLQYTMNRPSWPVAIDQSSMRMRCNPATAKRMVPPLVLANRF